MRIILVRHGESEGNIDSSAYVRKGDCNVSLTETGCAQALAAGLFLRDFYTSSNTTEWPRIFVSPYQRTLETLRGLYDGVKDAFEGLEPPQLHEDVRLAEKFFGALAYLEHGPHGLPEDLKNAFQALSSATYKNDPFTAATLFGDSDINIHSRIKGFIDGTLSRDVEEGGQDFLIVTHGAVIQAFIMAWAHCPMRSKAQIGNPGNCDVIEISGQRKNWTIQAIYDGQEKTPVHRDVLQNVHWLTMGTLPELPFSVVPQNNLTQG